MKDGVATEPDYKKMWKELQGDVQQLIDKEDSISRNTTDNIAHSRNAGRYSAFCHIQRLMDLYQYGRVRLL